MNAIVWTEQFATHHVGIDEQHRILFRLLDKARLGIATPQQANYRQIVLDLFKYVVEHFGYENDLMRNSAYPGHARHLAEHNRLVQLAMIFKERIFAGQEAKQDLAEFLSGWVLHHIASEDRLLADHLAKG